MPESCRATSVVDCARDQGIGAQLVQPGDDVVEPMAAIVAGTIFIVGANICYTLGWATELMWSGGDTSRTERVRPRIFRRGLIFSIVIEATPGVLIPLMWMIFGVGPELRSYRVENLHFTTPVITVLHD